MNKYRDLYVNFDINFVDNESIIITFDYTKYYKSGVVYDHQFNTLNYSTNHPKSLIDLTKEYLVDVLKINGFKESIW